MKPRTEHPAGELQELHHEEKPGCRRGFWIVLAVAAIVLVVAFLTAGDMPTHH